MKVDEVGSLKRRRFTEEFKAEAVQMLLDGYTAALVCERLGLSGFNLLYAWKRRLLWQGGPAAVGLESRVRELEAELRRVMRERDILKSAEHFRPGRVRDVYAGIDQIVLRERFAASAVCDLLEVSHSGFYAWRSSQESRRAERDRELVPVIREVFWCHRRRYGAWRIAVELSSRGIACGVAWVARLLKTQGFHAVQPKSYGPRTTQSRHRLGDNQNLLAGRAAPARINEVWVGDITYIPLATRTSNGRFGDLALLMDLYSRRIVGWEYGTSMSEELVLGALRRAIQERQPDVGLTHHTDRGGQYASRRYRDVLRWSAMQQSMSAAESCYDNAFMESCFGKVKTELELVEYANNSDAVRELSNYIRYYNGSRRHSSLGYVSPATFESQLTAQK